MLGIITRRCHRAVLLGTFLFCVTFGAGPAFAKRSAPVDVPPVVYKGVRYEAPHFNNPCGQHGGCIVARNDSTGVQLWVKTVYCTQQDADLETDVQDVFITSLAVEDGRLTIRNEMNLQFALDLNTQEISGDARGCSTVASPPEAGPHRTGCGGACVYAATSTHQAPTFTGGSLFALMLVVRRGLRGSVRRTRPAAAERPNKGLLPTDG